MKAIDKSKIQNLLDFLEPQQTLYDLGVCDSNLIALAGTGNYRNNVGKIRPEAYLSEVVKTGKPIILENKNSSSQCMKCNGKATCPYKGVIYLPLKIEDETWGAIYLMSKNKLHNDTDLYAAFLKKLSSFVVEVMGSERLVYENEKFANCLINLSHDGLITLSKKGMIRNINVPAKKIFNLLSRDLLNSDIRQLLPHFHINRPNSEYDYNDHYKIKIHPVADLGFILHIRPEFKFDSRGMDSIIGNSPLIKSAKERAFVIAKHDSPTLIIGETGTGKELFARAIHNQSARGQKHLITIDCSSIPSNLLESELFGYEEGAFTGAKHGGKKGKLELSHMSSMFLDEIGELPLHLQSKLLRVIENNSFDKLGDTKTTFVNTRIIAATNRDLKQMVQDGTFRKDLYYRLNVMQLDIPPLRSREGDIKILTTYFLDLYNKKFNKNASISEDILCLMEKHDWPGNVRELKNLIEYCVAFTKENQINYESMPDWFKNSMVYSDDASEHSKTSSMESAEKSFIEKSLTLYGKSTHGNEGGGDN